MQNTRRRRQSHEAPSSPTRGTRMTTNARTSGEPWHVSGRRGQVQVVAGEPIRVPAGVHHAHQPGQPRAACGATALDWEIFWGLRFRPGSPDNCERCEAALDSGHDSAAIPRSRRRSRHPRCRFTSRAGSPQPHTARSIIKTWSPATSGSMAKRSQGSTFRRASPAFAVLRIDPPPGTDPRQCPQTIC